MWPPKVLEAAGPRREHETPEDAGRAGCWPGGSWGWAKGQRTWQLGLMGDGEAVSLRRSGLGGTRVISDLSTGATEVTPGTLPT